MSSSNSSVPHTLTQLINNNTNNINIPLAHQRQSNPTNSVVYLDIAINDELIGRIVIELFYDTVPLTCENFRQFCIGYIDKQQQLIGYKHCTFHRVIKHFMIQGGDILHNNGTGTVSIYGNKFNDENFILKHKYGAVSMANAGSNSNGSQFFIITNNDSSHLDNKHVVFGSLIDGIDVVKRIENIKTNNDAPTVPVVISGCGEL